MLKLELFEQELYDEERKEFTSTESITLYLEHSLVSMAKWEQRFLKPFLGADEKTKEETYGYVEAMILNEDYPSNVLDFLELEHVSKINDYIDSPATATTFADLAPKRGPKNTQVITSELIYYWMVSYTIPFECETWHVNRLFALIRICSMKNSKPSKMSKSEIAARNRALNEERKAKLGTTG